jgi:Amt family ammonium transporter
MIAFILRKMGAEVQICENGQMAMEKALAALPNGDRADGDSEKPFDLVLMDMQMPVMDGYEATRQLRQRGYTGPIIALTAHAMKDDMQKCLDAGCDAYLTKPIEREQFLGTIAGYLRAPCTHGRPTPTNDAVATARAPTP